MFDNIVANNGSLDTFNDTIFFPDLFLQNDTDLDPTNSSFVSSTKSPALDHSEDFATKAVRELKWALILHTYGFGCLFFILAFYTFFSILNLRSLLSSRPFMSTINGFLCLLGASRSASLLIDPYTFKESMPRVFGQILWDLGYPGIMSAFCLVQLAFLQLTQLKLGPEGLRRKTILSLIITAHFTLTVAMDVIVALQEHLIMIKYVIQYVFLIWGILLCCNFLYSGYKVMLLIRKIPGGFQRDLPDPNQKGIMQLAMLAPYNNLAGSVTAALLPTLCAPKIHQQDVATSSLGFRNDPNSRILESESIPILEEVGCSSSDERSPLPTTRSSSFQNQARGSQRLNLKPKLSLQSCSDDGSPLSPRLRQDGFSFSGKSGNTRSLNTPKATESFVTTKDIHEFKSRIHSRTGFENENYKGVSAHKKEDSLLPNILVSCPSGRNSTEEIPQVQLHNTESIQKEDTLTERINQIQQDLKEMNIERDEGDRRSRKHASLSRKSSGEGASSSRKSSKRESQRLTVEPAISRRSSGCSAFSEASEAEDSDRSRKDSKRRQKSLSWRNKLLEEEPNAQDCLLPQDSQGGDVSLSAILNHIAYVNRANTSSESSAHDVDKVKRSQVEWVLNVTYVTAMWGLMLCLSTMSQVQTNVTAVHGTPILSRHSSSSNHYHTTSLFSNPWPWLWFQTFCRGLELAMGCAMANITRQPTANSRYPHTLRLRHRDTF